MLELINSARFQLYALFGVYALAIDSLGFGIMQKPIEFITMMVLMGSIVWITKTIVVLDLIELLGIEIDEDDED